VTNYDIRRLLRRARGTVILLPGIQETAGGKNAYLKALRALLRAIGVTARASATEEELNLLASRALGLATVAERAVNTILRLEAQRHTKTFMAGAKRALGIDLSAVVRDEDLTDYLRLASARNALLIKSLSEDAVKRVQQTVLDGLIAGTSRADVQKTLTEQFGIADNRAKLIAQDQMAKLSSDLTRVRHEQAGITEYDWYTSRDERVRPRHRALQGKRYRYGEPTGAEGGVGPGQAVRCRCFARGVVEF